MQNPFYKLLLQRHLLQILTVILNKLIKWSKMQIQSFILLKLVKKWGIKNYYKLP